MTQKIAKILVLLFCSTPLLTHEFNPAHLVIDELIENEYKVSWMYPIKNIGARAEVFFPATCQSDNQLPIQKGKYLVEEIYLLCESSLKGQVIRVNNLSVLTDSLVTIKHLNGEVFEGLMNLKRPSITIPLQEQVYPTGYFTLGIDHLFSGKDHILFILGLLFLITGFLNAVKTITAFTLAHSITLGLSVFELVSLPQATVEAIIALTIIYLAIEVSEYKKYQSTPWLIAFGFGLLHGLGFAGVISEIGLSQAHFITSLISFNVGVEIGQLFVIVGCYFGFAYWIKEKPWYKKYFTNTLSIIIALVGVYWFIERII